MTVDLSKLKAGDTIVLDYGDKQVVKKVNPTDNESYPYEVITDNLQYSYTADGRWSAELHSLIDIVEVIPAEKEQE